MLPEHSRLRLNCPWRATATSAMVRSTLRVHAATIGRVRRVVPVPATSASVASMPSWTLSPVQTDLQYVALRISSVESGKLLSIIPYEDLLVWQKAKELYVMIYRVLQIKRIFPLYALENLLKLEILLISGASLHFAHALSG